MSRRVLLIVAAGACMAAGSVVAWLRPPPTLARDIVCVGSACTPAPAYMGMRFCAQKHVTVLDASHARMDKLPCDEWHQP